MAVGAEGWRCSAVEGALPGGRRMDASGEGHISRGVLAVAVRVGPAAAVMLGLDCEEVEPDATEETDIGTGDDDARCVQQSQLCVWVFLKCSPLLVIIHHLLW